MLDALVLARLACAFTGAALLVWARPRIRPAVVIANSGMLLAPLLRGDFENEVSSNFDLPSPLNLT